MREIEFRGKSVDKKWIYGSLIDGYEEHKDGKKCIIDGEDCYLVDPATVGQYTNLRDKTKNKAYEDDIIDTPVGKAIIKFGEYSQPTGREWHTGFYLQFELELHIATLRKDLGYWMPQSRIIGNVHDDKELLEVAE
jgi:hypothetical protein